VVQDFSTLQGFYSLISQKHLVTINMRASTIFAAVTLLSTASAARLPTHYVRRCANETHNDTTPDTGSGIDPAPPSSCDLSGLSQPAHTLSAPAAGLDLVMIALGKGTQNYT